MYQNPPKSNPKCHDSKHVCSIVDKSFHNKLATNLAIIFRKFIINIRASLALCGHTQSALNSSTHRPVFFKIGEIMAFLRLSEKLPLLRETLTTFYSTGKITYNTAGCFNSQVGIISSEHDLVGLFMMIFNNSLCDNGSSLSLSRLPLHAPLKAIDSVETTLRICSESSITKVLHKTVC